MARKLQSLGFELVGDAAHVDVDAARDGAVAGGFGRTRWGRLPGRNATALVYYSGHGMAEAGSNWLVPVDDGDIRYREDVPTSPFRRGR